MDHATAAPSAPRAALAGGPLAAAVLAAAAPSLLAYHLAPSPTFLNQALALALWGLFLAAAPGGGVRQVWRPAAPLLAALAAIALGVLWSWGPGALPSSLALSALGLLAAAALLVQGGARAGAGPHAGALWAMFCLGWVVAGLVNAGLAMVQVFAPEWADGQWIARSSLPGRAVGNLRQPNHLSSLLMWAVVGLVALVQSGHLRARWGAVGLAALLFALVLSASRTGLVSVLLLAAWGLLDRRLSRPARGLLLAAPLLYALAWWGMSGWAQGGSHVFGGQARLAETDISSSRFGIWGNTWALIRQQPWTGVGFGEFNFAWSLSAFPGRPTAFFDHTHNLPLQLIVELGLPLAALVLLGLALAGVRAWQGAKAATGDGREARFATMFVLMIAVHSLLEYPLWYAYFLLPAAWAWGYALGAARPAAAQPRRGLALAGLALCLAAALATLDYLRVARIFDASASAQPLAERVAQGRRSLLFAHHADYAAATTGLPQPDGRQVFASATHYLLDTRLMVAWANALARDGEQALAQQLAARLREFGPARAPEFFAPCAGPDRPVAHWACQAPAEAADWRSFLRPADRR